LVLRGSEEFVCLILYLILIFSSSIGWLHPLFNSIILAEYYNESHLVQ
jgi:hypothetical protein